MKKWMAMVLCLVLGLPISGPQPPEKYVAITFDDGPAGGRTQRLLEGLAARKVCATFFVCGDLAAASPETMQAVANAGHEIGLHTCGHVYMHHMTKQEALQELAQCADRIESACGVRPRLFRPPGGLVNADVCAAASELDMPLILWSVDPEDWNPQTEDRVLPVLLRDARPGSILLMHELSENSVQCALQAIDRLQAAGYIFCTVSELAEKAGIRLQGGEIYRSFP